jgi:hypothetical protein
MLEDVLEAIHPVPEVARAAVCFMKGTEFAGMGARGVCREILKLHIDTFVELPAVRDCNRLELGSRPRTHVAINESNATPSRKSRCRAVRGRARVPHEGRPPEGCARTPSPASKPAPRPMPN